MKDLKIHREQLDNEMNGVIGDRNDLQDKISKINQQKISCSPLFSQIDEWQEITIEKVKQVAEQAREKVIKLLNSKQMTMASQFEMLSQELLQLKESDEYLEQDIKRLRQTMHVLNQDLKQLTEQSAVELHTEQSNKIVWDRMIYVAEKTTQMANQQHQQIATGKSIIDYLGGFLYMNKLLINQKTSAS
jgi:DNA repair exonuclease SbcCD ATPase subunit